MKRITSPKVNIHRAENGRWYLKGAASVRLNHSMGKARRTFNKGSMQSDWQRVGDDMRNALDTVGRDFEPA